MNTIKRTVKVLRLLAEKPLRFTDITRELELTKSTAHRLLVALEQGELIKKNPLTGCFHLGPIISQLAANPINEHQFLIVCSTDELCRLRDLSRETVTLQIPLGTERICLEEIQSRELIKYVSGKGAVYSIFVGSAGKLLLAMHDDAQLQTLMKSFPYESNAAKPITDPRDLLAAIKLARENGYSTSFGERITGSASVAVPINGYICPAIINILGPAERFTNDSILTILNEMKNSANKISEKLNRSR